MIQAISANNPIYFKQTHSKKSSEQSKKDENPISRKGEAMKLVAATFVGGLALAGRLILELAEGGDFILESIAKKAEKIAKKSGKNVNDKEVMKEAKKQVQKRRELNTIGAFVGLLAAFFAGVAILYTVFNAPKIAYESKVNSYKNKMQFLNQSSFFVDNRIK